MDEVKFGSVPVFGKKKVQPELFKLSPSSIATFRQCRLQYKFQYIDKLGEKYGRAKPYYTMANHVHATLYDLFSLIPPWDRTLETAKTLLQKNWRRYRVGFRSRTDEKRWAERALGEITRFVAEQDVTAAPMMLERPIEAEVSPGVILRGRVDRVDRQPDDSLHIIDYKTGKLPEEIDWSQLELHALILSHTTPYLVNRLSYFYLLPGIRESKEFDASALQQTAWDVLRVAREIREEKDYNPQPGHGCAGCDFSRICPAKDDGYVEVGKADLPLWRDFSDMLPEG
ncbi:MAG: PD-(D/E)XK nuclease family protein [Chloroflexota bacterium]|nr:PD-(D/E)XK nuclease family protein [Chloroflexota bacterium]